MKYLFVIAISFFLGSYLSAQVADFDDLKILYADGKYEKLISAAEKYSLKEDNKKNPLPLLWMAKGYYKISLSNSGNEKFKNAYKDAIGSLAKAMKIDKDSTLMKTNQEFIDEFQMSMAERVNNELSALKIKEAAGWATKYYKITNHPLGSRYLEASAKYRGGDKGGAATLWKECDKQLPLVKNLEDWSEADISILKAGILQTVECYIAARQVEKAVALMDKVAPWFAEDEEFVTRQKEIRK